ARLLGEGGLGELRMAALYRTRPLDCVPGTPFFVNTAVTGRWQGSGADLLALCLRTECLLGRPALHSSREGRVLDIDVLLVGSACLSLPGLVVPHPRLTERLFVLVPLAEIAPLWRIPPGMQTVVEARDRLLARRDSVGWGRRL
ncbi:MAG: 2-amino-4-hydroxy-6-hydroxymethyldihydropteridine diphosphokinase, partial [Lentisphaeria bacterium]|nr:2-amino-4-hydroxy-6-hydroxymethyldihydropteridine diphosphokinase [Lentisphaeria bacterium]